MKQPAAGSAPASLNVGLRAALKRARNALVTISEMSDATEQSSLREEADAAIEEIDNNVAAIFASPSDKDVAFDATQQERSAPPPAEAVEAVRRLPRSIVSAACRSTTAATPTPRGWSTAGQTA